MSERHGVSNHQPHDCLLDRLFGHRSKKTSKLRVTGPCVGNSPGPSVFPAQMVSNAENVSIWWCHHEEGHFLQTSPQTTYMGQHDGNMADLMFQEYLLKWKTTQKILIHWDTNKRANILHTTFSKEIYWKEMFTFIQISLQFVCGGPNNRWVHVVTGHPMEPWTKFSTLHLNVVFFHERKLILVQVITYRTK